MKILVSIYMVVVICVLALLALLLSPGALFMFAALTMGFGYFLIPPLLNSALWLLVFTPAMLGTLVSLRLAGGLAALGLVTALSFPHWLPDPAHDDPHLLAPPLAPRAPVMATSLEIDAGGMISDVQKVGDPIINTVLRNRNLQWVRLRSEKGTQLFSRDNGILYRDHSDHMRPADVIVQRPETEASQIIAHGGLSPWKIEDVSGYLIRDGHSGAILARNLSLKMYRAVSPPQLTITGPNASPQLEFLRDPYGEVAQDTALGLDVALRGLGLWPQIDKQELAPGKDLGNVTASAPGAVNAIMESLLAEEAALPTSKTISVHRDLVKRQGKEEFLAQIENGIMIGERIDLIARVERARFSEGDRRIYMEAARDEPRLMQRMVELYFADIRAEANYRILERVGQRASAPLAHAIGREAETFRALFEASTGPVRSALIELVLDLRLDDPYALLRGIFAPFPPLSELEHRLSPQYRTSWASRASAQDLIDSVRNGGSWTNNMDDHQRNASDVLYQILHHQDVPDEIVVEFIQRWALSRPYPIQFRHDEVARALNALDRVGATQELEAFSRYFQDYLHAL